MPAFTRTELEARYRLFARFALDDQRRYYQRTLSRNRTALQQVNRLTAQFSLFAGLAAALVGLLVASNFTSNGACSDTLMAPSNCSTLELIVAVLMVLSALMPILAAFFNTLSDLYQWERTSAVYEAGLENIEVADAQSPLSDMDDLVYQASVRAVVEGTLSVMADESAQWGQSIRTPVALEKFVEEERYKIQSESSG